VESMGGAGNKTVESMGGAGNKTVESIKKVKKHPGGKLRFPIRGVEEKEKVGRAVWIKKENAWRLPPPTTTNEAVSGKASRLVVRNNASKEKGEKIETLRVEDPGLAFQVSRLLELYTMRLELPISLTGSLYESGGSGKLSQGEGRHLVEKILLLGGTSLEEIRRFDAAEKILMLLDRDNMDKMELQELLLGVAMLSRGSPEEILHLGLQLYDEDQDTLLTGRELRSLLSAMSLPPRDVNELTKMEALVVLHAAPERAADANLADRRAYNRGRHMRAREVDLVPRYTVSDLLAALVAGGGFQAWVTSQQGNFRMRLAGRRR